MNVSNEDHSVTRSDPNRSIRASRGPTLTAKNWQTEAALRMLMNNLDPEVAERPADLVVYGGIGRAARDWESYDRIVATLTRLEDDQTLLVQSGKPVGVFRTHPDSPRVLIANSNLVPRWATWDHFNELDRRGLMMYGQMTAGSWIYIGSQGILQGTYETFAEVGRRHYGGDLGGRWVLTAGLGGMGGAQPLAAVMAGASCLAVECRPERIAMRLRSRYLDVQARDLDDALDRIDRSRRERAPVSVGLLGNAAEMLPELLRRGVRPDVVTDQTSAHDPVHGYLPAGWTVAEWEARQQVDPKTVERAARSSMADHVRAMLAWHRDGVPTFDYGNNIRQVAKDEGVADAFAFPGFVPAYIRPLFCRGIGPFRWCALSGDPEDIRKTDAEGEGADPGRQPPAPMARHGPGADRLPGAPGPHLLGRPRRPAPARAGVQRDGRPRRAGGPGRDRPGPPGFGLGGVPEPGDRGHGRRLGRGVRLAAAERPAQLCVRGHLGVPASWRRSRHGLLPARRESSSYATAPPAAARRIARVLWNDPATGVMRHADAGYEDAIACAREHGLDLPSVSAT